MQARFTPNRNKKQVAIRIYPNDKEQTAEKKKIKCRRTFVPSTKYYSSHTKIEKPLRSTLTPFIY